MIHLWPRSHFLSSFVVWSTLSFVMSAALKTHLAKLARTLSVTEGALYERQRALVREGILESVPGHGRGSGVRATPESLGLLLISLLASVNWSDAAALTK